MTDKEVRIFGHGSNTPSIKNLNTYASQRYAATFSVDGKTYRKGIIAVRRLKQMDAAHRIAFVNAYLTIIGRNHYNQDLRDYCYKAYKDGLYYSDCSSSGMYTLRQAGYDVPAYSTLGILTSDLFEDVAVTIKDGHITNPEILQPGDAILFAGNRYRPKNQFVGHVEWVYEVGTTAGTTTAKTTANTTAKAISVATTEITNGCSGENVKTLQRILNALGYKGENGKTLTVDGKAGTQTIYAAKTFQSDHNLTVDGEVGPKTWDKLING